MCYGAWMVVETMERRWFCGRREYGCALELAAIGDDDVSLGLSRLTALSFDGLHDIHSIGDSAENYVLPVKPLSFDCAEEKLRAVGVGAGVSHGENAGSGVLLLEVLVGEFLPVDGLTASSVASREVSTLAHEVRDDPMEFASFEMEWLSLLSHSLLSGAESSEVLSSPGNDI